MVGRVGVSRSLWKSLWKGTHMPTFRRVIHAAATALLLVCPATSTAQTYRVVERHPLPGDGEWDYITVDSASRRVYASHGNRVEVLDADSGRLVGEILDTPGVHGVALAPEFRRGFSSNGGDGSVTIFDIGTLEAVKKVRVNRPDAILYDSFSKRVFPWSEVTTVVDAKTGAILGDLGLGGQPEAAISDGTGTVYVNLADKSVIAVVDTLALRVSKSYPVDRCSSPHSLAYDAINQRLLVGCLDGLVVLDAKSGNVVGRSLICSGVDAGAFDSDSKLLFESCSEGVVSVLHQITPDFYELVDTVKTQLWARTLTLDSRTKKLYLPTAEFELVPNTTRHEFRVKPGSFTVLVVAP